MTVSLQVLYPVGPDLTFDYDYYGGRHMEIVGEHFGPFLASAQASKGLAGGPGIPPAYFAIATLLFESQDKFDQAMAVAGPVLADIPNFTNTSPQMLIGEVIS